MIAQIFIGLIFILFSVLWIYAARKENGSFDKKEVVQLLLGGAFCLILFQEVTEAPVDWAKWTLVLGSLITSVGIKAFEALKNK